MISASLPTLPAAPGPSGANPSGSPAEAPQDAKARPFARLLTAAGGSTKDGRRPVGSATGKHEGVQEPVRPAPPGTQQAEPTGEVPADGPAPESATATDPTALPTDAAALLAALPPLQPRPLPPPSGNEGPLRSGRDTRLPAGAGGPTESAQAAPAAPGSAASAPATGAAAFADALREAASADIDKTAKPAAVEPAPLPPTPAHLPTATTVAASAPAEARIAATPGSADFASQLGAQLSTFVRDGVQHARLELHPVELGPVTVQIQLDGNNAQVNLAAEQAPTRAALEDALPQLAGSLREAGLTLTGGGVFEQPRQSADGRSDGSAPTRESRVRSERDAARESVTLQPLAAPRRRGVVDLVA